MDAGLVSASSALAGAAIGGLMSLVASWLASQRQARAQWLAHDRSRRDDLYKEFIEEAAKCYVDALLHDEPDVASLVVLYAKMSRMRVQSSREVVESAEQLIDQIIDSYSKPAKTLVEIKDGSLDIIGNFSERCRTEFESLRAQTF